MLEAERADGSRGCVYCQRSRRGWRVVQGFRRELVVGEKQRRVRRRRVDAARFEVPATASYS